MVDITNAPFGTTVEDNFCLAHQIINIMKAFLPDRYLQSL